MALLLATGGPLVGADDRRPMALPDLLAFRSVEEIKASPDGARVAFLVRSADAQANRQRSELWLATTDGSAEARPLSEAGAASPIRWSPDGREIAFLASRAAGPTQVWSLSLGGGEARALTRAATAVADFAFSPDGRRLLFLAGTAETEAELRRNKQGDDARLLGRDWRNQRLWVAPSEGGEPQALTDGSESVREAAWAPDGRRIAIVVTPTPEADSSLDAHLRVVDAESRQLLDVPDSGLAHSPAWSPDGRRLAFVRPFDGREISRADLYVWGLGATAPRDVSQSLDRDVEWLRWEPDAGALHVLVSRGARSLLAKIDLATERATELWAPATALGAVDRTDTRWVYVPGHGPDEVWVASGDGAGPRAVTQLNQREIDLPRHEVLRYSGPRGEIEALLTRPPGSERRPLPLIVRPHGGPRDHAADSFDPQIAALAAEGFLVLQPNFRGSTGYGDAFTKANVGDWGSGPFADIMAGVDHLVRAGEADGSRLFLYGWSYGGIMANWAVTHEGRFRAIVSGAGVADFRMQYVLSDARRWRFDYFGGSPFSGALPAYERQSPVSYAARARVPTLFIHGEQDVRCPLAQGLMMHRALMDAGVETEMVIYPREGHGFEEPAHLVDRLRRVLTWFRAHDSAATTSGR